MSEDRRHHFVSVLGEAVDSARLAGLCLHLVLEDGTEVSGVPQETPLAHGPNETEIDDSGVRADLEIDGTLIMVERVARFAIDRPD